MSLSTLNSPSLCVNIFLNFPHRVYYIRIQMELPNTYTNLLNTSCSKTQNFVIIETLRFFVFERT